MNKKELFAELNDRGINFNPKATNKELNKLLSEDVKDDIIDTTGDGDMKVGISPSSPSIDINVKGNISLGMYSPTAKLNIVGTVEEEFLVDKYEASYISKGRTFILGVYATLNDAKYALERAGAYNQKIKHITKIDY